MAAEVPEFSDPHARQLYDWTKIRSVDVGFHWPTECLMLHYLRELSLAEDETEMAQRICAGAKGDWVWSLIRPHLQKMNEWFRQ